MGLPGMSRGRGGMTRWRAGHREVKMENECDTKKVKSCLPGWETVHLHIKDKDNIHCKF